MKWEPMQLSFSAWNTIENSPTYPDLNQKLTKEIAKFHVESLDKIGSLYYSEESFDDFYYGKGSTFPDINGSIGILFEQASSRGHVQDSDNGLLRFPLQLKINLPLAYLL